ncbi:hypothetical protein JQN58_05805 [Aneurinibacillus sp. BA2021]|nr:hypothetical protein [Aneurinibacillus sp. BA2021]
MQMHAEYLRGRFPHWEIPRPYDEYPYMIREYEDVGGDGIAVFITPEEAFVIRSRGTGDHFITYDEYMSASVYYAEHMSTRSVPIFRYVPEKGKIQVDKTLAAGLFDPHTINSIGHAIQAYHAIAKKNTG